MVAYGCLFSGLRYICNTCTQVADRYITLILRKVSNVLMLLLLLGKFIFPDIFHGTWFVSSVIVLMVIIFILIYLQKNR